MKNLSGNLPFKFVLFLVLGAFVLQSDTCTKDEVCNSNPDLTVSTKRTQTWTEFTLTGKGFGPGADIKASVHNQPPGLPVNQDLGYVVKADANGSFSITWHPQGGYLPLPVNSDVEPYFTATDQKGCLGSTVPLSSAFWY